MELSQALEFLAAARKLGVRKISINGMQAEFDWTAPPPPPKSTTLPQDDTVGLNPAILAPSAQEAALAHMDANKDLYVDLAKHEGIEKALQELETLTPEEVLYYATPHYDELQAAKNRGKDDK